MTEFRDNYLEAIWALMIGYGGSYEPDEWEMKFYDASKFEYIPPRPGAETYSSSLNFSYDKTMDALTQLKEHGIDLANCTDPANYTSSHFNGTFASSPLYCKWLYGYLACKNGSRFTWATGVDVDDSFGAVVRLLTSHNLSLEGALEKLEDRLTDPALTKYGHLDKYLFQYGCEIR